MQLYTYQLHVDALYKRTLQMPWQTSSEQLYVRSTLTNPMGLALGEGVPPKITFGRSPAAHPPMRSAAANLSAHPTTTPWAMTHPCVTYVECKVIAYKVIAYI